MDFLNKINFILTLIDVFEKQMTKFYEI